MKIYVITYIKGYEDVDISVNDNIAIARTSFQRPLRLGADGRTWHYVPTTKPAFFIFFVGFVLVRSHLKLINYESRAFYEQAAACSSRDPNIVGSKLTPGPPL